MSGHNESVVRRMLEAFSARPNESARIVAEFWDADGDYYPLRKFPEARPCHGSEEVARFLANYVEAWTPDYAITELIEVGDDRVLAGATLRAEGRGSGMKLEGDMYHCIWLRHRRILRQEDHLTLKGALHALGLEGDTLHAAGLRKHP
jgi:hypothetical protein